ncbi:hypothetical protein GPECTOR_61g861 [Gonium pectorale]|uniref:Uncharacterized protein n=1 Tax=Gonium pectorale TaxID=33097 RepID=A0A150G509_GONPE|nr:hypothetical protein GPECTOR_61g861 [Gonium pectorale]|eukprot:KXZ44908.1 hypothetical protein GPECTOR_61g861 [Gonium pectorale]
MLQRALEMSERGCVQSARKAAVGLLDFHKMVEKYRQVVASRTKSSSSGHSTGSGKRQNSEELDSETSEDASGPLKRQRTSGVEDLGAGASDADIIITASAPAPAPVSGEPSLPLRTNSAEFAVPHLPAKKSPHAAAPGQPAPHAHAGPEPASAPAAPASVVWTGCVRQPNPNGRDLVFCRLSIPLPAECVAELSQGPDMEVSQLAPRRGVKLGRHRVCKCTLLDATPAQLTKLKSMAQNELVALAPLERHGLILVPYLDNAGGVRMVCFCLTL